MFKPISGNDRAAQKLLLLLKVVKIDLKIVFSILLARLSLHPWYDLYYLKSDLLYMIW